MTIPNLNRGQRAVVLGAALLIAATGVYAPRHTRANHASIGGPVTQTDTSFDFIFRPYGTLALGTLAAEWFVILALAGALVLIFRARRGAE